MIGDAGRIPIFAAQSAPLAAFGGYQARIDAKFFRADQPPPDTGQQCLRMGSTGRYAPLITAMAVFFNEIFIRQSFNERPESRFMTPSAIG
jgi:hypothetical protein